MARMKTEAQWQAESDAQSLINAEQIKAVPARLKRAKTAARKLAADAAKAANQAKRVAGSNKAPRKSPARRRR